MNCSTSAATRSTYGCSALAQTGDVKALPNRPPGNNHKITDWEEFRAFAKTHGDKTQVEMAQLWQGDISDSEALLRSADRTISRASQENWVHAKKKTYGYLERDESKRQSFIEQLAKWADEMIIYVDEAPHDNREDYSYGWNQRGQRFHALKSGRRQGRVNMIAAQRFRATDGSLYGRRLLQSECGKRFGWKLA